MVKVRSPIVVESPRMKRLMWLRKRQWNHIKNSCRYYSVDAYRQKTLRPRVLCSTCHQFQQRVPGNMTNIHDRNDHFWGGCEVSWCHCLKNHVKRRAIELAQETSKERGRLMKLKDQDFWMEVANKKVSNFGYPYT